MAKSRIIVKIGTQILTTPSGQLDLNSLRNLVYQIAREAESRNCQFLVVTSGATTCGSEHLSLTAKSIPEKQATAAVGQILLIQQYFHFFQERGFPIAQILLTRDALETEGRRLHAKNTLETLFARGVIPVINENDTVAVDEIRFGDNDELSSLVSPLVHAQLLILLSDIDGLYTANPKKDPAATLIQKVPKVTDKIMALVDDVEGGRSRGGMRSKITAARYAASHGTEVVIANGRTPHIIRDILAGKSVGTRIVGKKGRS